MIWWHFKMSFEGRKRPCSAWLGSFSGSQLLFWAGICRCLKLVEGSLWAFRWLLKLPMPAIETLLQRQARIWHQNRCSTENICGILQPRTCTQLLLRAACGTNLRNGLCCEIFQFFLFCCRRCFSRCFSCSGWSWWAWCTLTGNTMRWPTPSWASWRPRCWWTSSSGSRHPHPWLGKSWRKWLLITLRMVFRPWILCFSPHISCCSLCFEGRA